MSPFIAYDLKMFEKKNLSGRSNKVYHPDLLCSFEHWMTLLLTNIELNWKFIHRTRNQKQPNILVYLHYLWIAVVPVVYYSYSWIHLSSENEWISLTDVPRKKLKLGNASTTACLLPCLKTCWPWLGWEYEDHQYPIHSVEFSLGQHI